MYKMREMTDEESKTYQESLNKIYKPTGLNIYNMRMTTPEERESIDNYIDSISTKTGVKFYDEEDKDMSKTKFTTGEGTVVDESFNELYERKDMLSDNLDAIEARLNALVEEFTSISTEMSTQIQEIRSMLDDLC